MICLERITKSYRTRKGEVPCLRDLTIEVKTGEFLVVEGPSGCGKTTLLLMMGGMLQPSSGRVLLDGEDFYSLNRSARACIRAQKIGFVFQMFHLVPYLNALENVLLASPSHARSSQQQRAKELLVELGLASRLSHKSEELSTGERQRTAIARALLNNPKLILADEPTGNLDPNNGSEVFRHLSQFHQKGGTVIVVTHGTMARDFADRTFTLS